MIAEALTTPDGSTFLPPSPHVGDSVPVQWCPRCRSVSQEWVYNPYCRSGPTYNGWVLYDSPLCDCTAAAAVLPWQQPRPDPDLAWLDRQLNREAHRLQTFTAFKSTDHPHCQAALARCQHYARTAPPEGGPRGLYLAGPASPTRFHLLAAVTNAHRAHGVPTALVTGAHLLEILDEGSGDGVMAAILRRIQVLALDGALSTPATPLELKPLLALLQRRQRRGLTTHVAAHATPSVLLAAAKATDRHPIHQELATTLGTLTLDPVRLP